MSSTAADSEGLAMTPSVVAFTATHILYITPHGGPFMKPAEAFDITSLVTSTPGSKEFHAQINKIIKHSIKSANPPPIAFASTKPSRFASTSTLSTPSNPNLGSITTPIINTLPAIIKFSDATFHPEISMRQAFYALRRTMVFVYNSREYKWNWGMWTPTKLTVDANGGSGVAALFFAKGNFQLGGVIVVDESKVDLSVAFASILICLKKERERRHF